jgi:hypothetical protein
MGFRKVDPDVVYTCMLRTYVLSVLRFHTYVCKCFIWMLYMFAMVFKCFSGVFTSVSDDCFKCFICLLLYVATIVSGCFKSKSGVAHEMHVESGWRSGRRLRWRGRRLGRRGPTASACVPCVGVVRTLATRSDVLALASLLIVMQPSSDLKRALVDRACSAVMLNHIEQAGLV